MAHVPRRSPPVGCEPVSCPKLAPTPALRRASLTHGAASRAHAQGLARRLQDMRHVLDKQGHEGEHARDAVSRPSSHSLQAVLLLHPSVPLYSTDAIPINCSAQALTAEATASSSSRARATSLNSAERPRPIARTCDCLTQTLWCHGCGTAVGYMIVTPCLRCTSSVAPNNRSTNGHRFVFYSAEIVASERHHVPGESGIVPQAQAAETADASPAPADLSLQRSQHTPPPARMLARGHSPRTPNPPAQDSSSLPPPSSPRSDATSSPPPLVPITPTRPPAQIAVPPLCEGDVVFWHHLVRSGEIPAVMDDPRARVPAKDAADAGAPDAKGARRDDATASRKMVAGR